VGELGQRRDQPQGQVDVALGEGELERGPEVVDIRQRRLDPRALVDALHPAGGRLGEADEVLGVPPFGAVVAFPGVGAQGLQHAVNG
jgi:hypothetical protein